MYPTARRCVWAAVLLWVAGAALTGTAPTLYRLADGWTVNGWVTGAFDVLVGFLQLALVPTGAALIGAAVVIQTLKGTRPSRGMPAVDLPEADDSSSDPFPTAPEG
ncbi:MAG: hypothetical protein FWD18_05835 [Micrococcales bacterium]|nr:hypothetical protein [Micrococcales bacterium]